MFEAKGLLGWWDSSASSQPSEMAWLSRAAGFRTPMTCLLLPQAFIIVVPLRIYNPVHSSSHLPHHQLLCCSLPLFDVVNITKENLQKTGVLTCDI